MKDFDLDTIRDLIPQAMNMTATGNGFLDRRFNQHATAFTRPRYYWRLFYLIAQTLDPASVVELGGWQGTGAAHFAGGMRRGNVVSVDHHSDPGDDLNETLMWEAVSESAGKLVYLKGWTWDVVNEVKRWGPIDILFIDGWHHYDKAIKDWNDYRPLLADTALVICDDIMPNDGGTMIVDMERFWVEMPEPKFLDNQMWPNIPMGFVKYVRTD